VLLPGGGAQVRFPRGEGGSLALGARGEHFAAAFNAQQSALEALLLKRRIKGPSWMLLSAPVARTGSEMVSSRRGGGGGGAGARGAGDRCRTCCRR